MHNRMLEIQEGLQRIENGKLCLDSEFNEMYDDWL